MHIFANNGCPSVNLCSSLRPISSYFRSYGQKCWFIYIYWLWIVFFLLFIQNGLVMTHSESATYSLSVVIESHSSVHSVWVAQVHLLYSFTRRNGSLWVQVQLMRRSPSPLRWICLILGCVNQTQGAPASHPNRIPNVDSLILCLNLIIINHLLS